MKRAILLVFLVFTCTLMFGQSGVVSRLRVSQTSPPDSDCNPLSGDVTADGAGNIYTCTGLNAWTIVGSGGGGGSTIFEANGSVLHSSNPVNFQNGANITISNPSSGNVQFSVSGTLSPAQLPTPTASTLGGVESITSVTHQWVGYIDTSGVPHQSQPACGDLSNSVASCSTDATNATNISSGTLNTARMPSVINVLTGFEINSLAASGHYLRGNGSNYVDSTIQTADVPTLNQNTSGTAANLSGTPALPNGTTATTQTSSDNTTKLATDAFVQTAVTGFAPLASPTFTGTVTSPALTLSGITGTTQCLHVSTAGVVTGTGSDCGAGGGGGGSVTQVNPATGSGTITNLGTFGFASQTTTPTLTVSLSTAGAHTFFGNNTGTSAAPNYLQLACADLSNAAASCSTDTTNATNISSGTLNTARLPAIINITTGFEIGSAAASGHYLRGNGTNYIDGAIQTADVPTLNQSTTGTAANLSGTPALPNGTTATTQTGGDSTTKLATDAFVASAIGALAPLASPTFTGTVTVPALTLSGITGSTECLHVNTSGVVSGTGSDCGSGAGGDNITTPNSTLVVSGSSTNTTLDVIGAAGKVLAGATPALTPTPTLGVQNTTQGTLTLAGSTVNPGQLILNIAGATANALTIQPGANTGGVTLTAPTTGGTIPSTATSPITLSPAGAIACATCGVTGNPLSQFASTTSAQLAGVLSDETGTGVAVFATSPTLVTPNLGTPGTLVLTNATGLPNAGLVNAATTVNGQTCTLGSTCNVESATAGQIAVSGGTGAALTGWADLTVSSHTGTLGSLGILDLHSAATSGFLLPGGLSTGIVTVTTTTGAVSSVAAPAGTVVGTTDTQTLTNKSIAGSEINSGTVSASFLPTATSGAKGVVQTDASTISVSSGTISCTTSTVSQLGCVKPDGSTITVSGGVISATSSGTPLSGISAATSNSHTIANGNNYGQVWNWAMTTASTTAFTFGETSAATGSGDELLLVNTVAGSTAVPLTVQSSLSGTQTLSSLHVLPTWNTTGVVDAGILENVVNTASGTGSLLMDLQVGGTSQFNVDKAGNVTIQGAISAAGSVGVGTLIEGTCPSGVASNDVLCADSTKHRLTQNPNNGGYVNLVVSGVDINTSDQVTNGSHITNSSIPNTGLVNTGTTVNGQTCTLGSSCNIESATAGQLAVSGGTGAALTGSADFTVSSHTLSSGVSGIFDIHAASATAGFLPPSAAGAAPTTSGVVAYDSTNHNLAFGNGSTTNHDAFVTGSTPSAGIATFAGSTYAVTSTATTGTGNVVLATNPAFTTPNLGTPSAVTLTNGTGLPLGGLSTQAADTLVMNVSASTATPTAVSLAALGGTNSCAGASNALTYNSTTHAWGCNTISAGGIAFPVTVSGTTTSGGIPYFSNVTTLTSSAALASTALVVGGGAGGAPATGNADFTYATHTLISGASGILDLHSAATTGFLLPGGLSTGIVTVTTTTGAVSSVAAPAGTIVGTTDTQTLTNKSIAGSEINSSTVGATFGGTGIDSHLSTGVAQITSGTWSISTTLPSGLSATNLTLTTPTLGVAAATTINKVTLTAPATGSTLTIADGKTLTVNNSLTLAGTDSTTMTFPSTSDTVVTLGATQTLTNKTLTTAALGSSTATTQAANDNSTKVATTAYVDGKAATLATGTSVSLSAPAEIYVCTSTCTVTPPVPAAGYQFCVFNGDNVATVITLAALGSSARYENTARTAYGTAGTGTFVSGGAVKDSVCIIGLDSTHYITTNSSGTWVAN